MRRCRNTCPTFRARFRRAAFGWKGSRLAIERIHEALGERLLVLRGSEDGLDKAVASAEDHFIVAIGGRKVWIWDASTGGSVAVLEGDEKSIIGFSVSPDRQWIVTASVDTTAIVWRISGSPVAVLQGHADVVMSAVFSPDGARVVTAASDATARIWDSVTGRELLCLEGHTVSVGWATFDQSGQRILRGQFGYKCRRKCCFESGT
jgi:WD40 repeat protein